jgi:Tfp pilus assembly protein PilF
MLFSLFLLLFAQGAAQTAVNTAADLPAAIQLAQEGHEAEALAALQKIAAVHPDDHLTRLWIANVQARMGHPELAEPIYYSIALEDPRNVDAWLGLGTVLLQMDRVSEGLDALTHAEQLAPRNPNVLAALGSGYRLAGDAPRSISYYEQLATTSPTVVNRLDLERARSERAHRLDSQTFGEQYSHTTPKTPSTGGEDLALNYRVSETFRVIGRGQVQRKFSLDEHAFGGGAQWRWTPWGTLTSQLLFGSEDNRVLPQHAFFARVDYGYHRATYTGTLRYFDFLGANETVVSPAVTVAITPRWTAEGVYAFTTTDTAVSNGIQGNTVDLRAAHEIAPRVWLRGGYIHGIANFDQFSIDQIGNFRANTAHGGMQLVFPSLTSLVFDYQYQWRDGGVRMGRVNVGLVQAF